MLLGVWLACTPADETEETCGLDPEVIPAFTLIDENPSSPTWGQEVARDDHLGDVGTIWVFFGG